MHDRCSPGSACSAAVAVLGGAQNVDATGISMSACPCIIADYLDCLGQAYQCLNAVERLGRKGSWVYY